MTAPAVVRAVRFEHHREALGIGESRPRVSWKVATDAGGWTQTGFELEVTDPDAGGGAPWSTGRVDSPESVLVDWPAAPLRSRERRAVRVRAWGPGGDGPSPWSEPAVVEAGLLQPADWTAAAIAPEWEEDTSADQPVPLLRGRFALRGDAAAARLYATAHGVYELELNGVRVGDHVLAPGWTSYRHRLRYQTFDVTALLRAGDNVLGAMLGDGWFRGRIGFNGGRRNVYGDRTALLAQVEVRYADGSSERFGTGAGWRAARGPILAASLYDGETYDARRELAGWSSPGFDDGGWEGVRVVDFDRARLEAPAGPPVRRTQEVAPVTTLTSPSGATLLDFGQNLVGRLRIRVEGEAGRTITLRHAEVLEHGELGVRPLRTARATDAYTLRGGGPEEWEPRFTFHGFRYAQVDGWPGALEPGAVTAVVCHTDMERTGWFSCSDALLERLHENVVWSMRGNFLDVPTDCPQRDERLGWTGDAQVFAPTGAFLHDCAGLLASWLRDVAAEQTPEGVVPVYVPFLEVGFSPPKEGSPLDGDPREAAVAAWGDAAAIVPWVLYERFADAGVLAAQFDSMRAWVDALVARASDALLWSRGAQLGDWLDPTAPPDEPWRAATDPHLVAQAYLVRSADLVARTAEVLERAGDAARYRAIADGARTAFSREYVSPSGRIASDSQTAYALALEFALLPTEAQRARAGARLGELVRRAGHRIATGFVGTPLICDALIAAGEPDAAYRLLLQRECPSWLYSVTMGATTLWERWDSMLPDGTVNPGEMTSFNHYALGAVADWLHRTVAGLAPAAPAYRRLRVQPLPGGGLHHAAAAHETPYGRAEVTWTRADGALTLDVLVPPGTTAEVVLPGDQGERAEVGAGRHRFTVPYPGPEADDAPAPAAGARTP